MIKANSKRIDNLEFKVSSYLLPDSRLPEHIGYSIIKYYDNPYYGKEHEYEKVGGFYIKPNEEFPIRIHESCFKNPQSSYVIASWTWDEHNSYYDFEFCADRPLKLNEEERKVFWELVEYGFDILNRGKETEYIIRQFWKYPFKYDGYGNIVDSTGTMLVFSFNIGYVLPSDEKYFIPNFVRLLNGEKTATAIENHCIDSDGILLIGEEEIGKFRGYENLEEYYKISENTYMAWDIWASFLAFCSNRLSKN